LSGGVYDYDHNNNERRHDTVMVDLFLSAAMRNRNHDFYVTLSGLPIAESVLMMAVGEESSSLRRLDITSCVMVEDQPNYRPPVLESFSFSRRITTISLAQTFSPAESDFDSVRKMGRLFSQICGRLPSLEEVGVHVPKSDRSGAGFGIDMSHLLTNPKKLKRIRYGVLEGGQSHRPFFNLLRQAYALESLFLMVQNNDLMQQTLTAAISHNYNITQNVFYNWDEFGHSFDIASINSHCTRNQRFLENWEDLTVDIRPALFHLAAAIAVKSQRGRAAVHC
jgi:hypothetical protein